MKTVIPCTCPICSYSLAAPFFDGGLQTLATLNWSSSKEDAQAMPRYPHDFVQCPACSHVWNRSFDYAAIPYQNNPNRMGGDLARAFSEDTRYCVSTTA